MATFKDYYSLVKPGVLYGNVITAIAGFLFASGSSLDIALLLALLFGTSFIIGSACALNNYLDQDIDMLMDRTKTRALVSGKVPPQHALILSIVLAVLGLMILTTFTNFLVVVIGVAGFVVYVYLYGMTSKRKSIHGTLVGSVSGAAPILAGYVAVSERIDMNAFILFIILFLWQMPEFYAIAIYRLKEYEKAHVPIISVIKGVAHTKKLILIYVALFVASTLLLAVYGTASKSYLVVMSVLGIYWLYVGLKGQRSMPTQQNNDWAKKMFRISLIILLAFSLLISINHLLP